MAAHAPLWTAPRRTPCRRARSAQPRLEILIGARQGRALVALQQTGPGALRHCADGPQQGSAGGPTPRWGAGPGPQAGPPVALDVRALERWGLGQARSRACAPALGGTHQGPPRSGVGSPLVPPGWETCAGGRPGPLFATRANAARGALRRAWRGRPAAARGGGPAAVRARRTARPSPRRRSALAAVRSSPWGSRGRPPIGANLLVEKCLSYAYAA